MSENHTHWLPALEQLLDARFEPTGTGRPFIHKLLAHWTIPSDKHLAPPIPAYTATPKGLRTIWQKEEKTRPEMKPPYAIPHYLNMSQDQWSVYGSLNIPHRVRNFWWRLLLHKVPTRSRLAKYNMPEVPTPICEICQLIPEDDHHMVIGCPSKEKLWHQALTHAGIQLSPTEIWNTVTFVTVPRKKKKIKEHTTTLRILARILMIVWQQHWAAVLDDNPWSVEKAYGSYLLHLWTRYVSGIDADLPQIWDFLTFQTATDKATLLRLSYILLVIWQMHWHCIFNEVPWNTTHALERLRRLRWLSGTVPQR